MRSIQQTIITGVPAPQPAQLWDKLRGDRFQITFEASGTELIALHAPTYKVGGCPSNSCRRVTDELRTVVLDALDKVGVEGRHAEILHQFTNITGSLGCEPPASPL